MAGENKLSDKALKALHGKPQPRQDLYTDDDGDEVASLVVYDTPREAREIDPALVGAPKLSDNHMAVWQAIRSRTAKGKPSTRAVIRDDLKAAGMDTSKHFSRWLTKLIDLGMVVKEGENLSIRSLREVAE
ncbi:MULTISPECIES: Cro/Cl family transcriptional regulator [Raoultella]|uniref:Cro/Cl family transcriptional regulator n=1 Tax=Raoultella TaxID=160674 RepID=UPI000B4D686C|nr:MULTISPECIES: Cro/Cl family transcriptional regulator [Raoultella]MBK2607859.1 Cro/Cl family transcriptional regulator [Raoultella ornithinolytica]MCF6709156.1 Cro/Cl family transcriptional regulator [Raoultella ornithinolytica]MDX7498225.1 Cro/Cl family transcriptional regulator [Raoultella ornithinolytica]OWP38720.1 Cro/Cl family transcriptional regulator [Raoultella ornithinolytica]QLK16564.1 Cro/Cl family transcriptional regulator [Raoultella ornithinolytica]